jgi:hypothetical protein
VWGTKKMAIHHSGFLILLYFTSIGLQQCPFNGSDWLHFMNSVCIINSLLSLNHFSAYLDIIPSSTSYVSAKTLMEAHSPTEDYLSD